MSDRVLSFDETLEKFDPVVGFEIHVELNTKTKMFCSCPNSFGDEPNTNICPICLGLPGALPKVNAAAVASAIKIGLALGCKIAASSNFSRKNYFYPDTPKNFQTSQYDDPICYDGEVEVEMDDGTIFIVDIERAHMEEDAGKLSHVGGVGRIQGSEYSLVDCNRAGVPLVEIVTRPVKGVGKYAPELARKYLAMIRDIVKSLGVSEARMEQGNVRCDANVSLRRIGVEAFGVRTETKNMNSFRAAEKAVRYEMMRHAAILDAGGSIMQETRHWHEETGTTTSGRPKSDSDDYRYFPEPDLVTVFPDDDFLEDVRSSMPELPNARMKRLQGELGYTDFEFRDVVNSGLLDSVIDTVAAGVSSDVARKWWMGEISRRAKVSGMSPVSLGVTAEVILELESLVSSGRINDRLARDVLDGFLAGEGTLEEVIIGRGLEVVSDDGALLQAIAAAFVDNPDVVVKIRQGKVQAAGAIVGAVMRSTMGKADASRVRELVLERALEK